MSDVFTAREIEQVGEFDEVGVVPLDSDVFEWRCQE